MKAALTFIFVGIYCASFAQLDPLSGMFWNNYTTLNPGHSGLKYDKFISLQGRDQWPEIEGNPQTIWAIADFKVDKLHGGAGLNYYYEKLAQMSIHKLMFNYNYQFSITEKQKLALGLSFGYQQVTIHANEYNWVYPDGVDPYVPTEDVSSSNLNLGFGISYTCNQFELGLSLTNLNEPNYSLYRSNLVYPRHFYVYSSYNIQLAENLAFNPRLILRSLSFADNYYKEEVTDLNLNFLILNHFSFGGTYRKYSSTRNDLLGLLIGVNFLDKFNISYMHEFSNDEFLDVTSNELSLSYFILRKKVNE